MPTAPSLLLTCEHGGNLIPSDYAAHFRARDRLLHSHRGWDPGALDLATHLATSLPAPLTAALVSRLLVDLNRSPDNPSLFSSISAPLDDTARAAILQRYYSPYRESVTRQVRDSARSHRQMLHISIHTFTPVLRGRTRDVDVGLLFDPARPREAAFARAWKSALAAKLRLHGSAPLRLGFNTPYRGTDDGLTTHLRTQFPDRAYAGLELEVNQRFARRPGRAWRIIKLALVDSLRELGFGAPTR
ncbi:MAG: N-formylglutamate amidohydrolase [Phycisphaerales bacterium]|nr:N-formylglutamate amidohydrolase [Phycisphaerales bacterium]